MVSLVCDVTHGPLVLLLINITIIMCVYAFSKSFSSERCGPWGSCFSSNEIFCILFDLFALKIQHVQVLTKKRFEILNLTCIEIISTKFGLKSSLGAGILPIPRGDDVKMHL